MFEEIKKLLIDILQLGDNGKNLRYETPLLGNIPEFDSMAVVTVITALEDYYGIFVDDDEISADTFATLGSLVDFIEQKVSG